MASFLGMRGTGDWTGNERPESWREYMLYQNPNGDMPLTAITSKGRSRKVDDPKFHWFSKTMATQGSTVTGKYKNTALDSAYGGGDAAAVGAMIYAKMAEADLQHFRPGHTVLLVDISDDSVDAFGKVTAINANGADSFVAIKTRVAADAGNVAACDYLQVVGNCNPEGSIIPDAIAYDSTEYYGYTQIFRTPTDITRTQSKTHLRIGDARVEAKRDAALYHGIEIERALLFGKYAKTIGDNRKPERTCDGAINFLRTNNSAGIVDYPSNTSLNWLQGGEDWLDEQLETLFRYGRKTKLALCGTTALRGINRLVKVNGQFQFEAETAAYGLKVKRWITPYGDLIIQTHPLFSHQEARRKSMLILEPENLQFAYIDDTHFKSSKDVSSAGYSGYDGIKEEFLTEAGMEFHFPETMMYLTGLNDNGTA